MYQRTPPPVEPARRLRAWMRQRGYSHQRLANAIPRFEVQYSKSSIDSFSAAKRHIPVDFAKAVAALDSQIVQKEGGDPEAAIRWQYLAGIDDLPTMNYQPMIDAWEFAQQEVMREDKERDAMFSEYGYTCERVKGGFLLSLEGAPPRRISLKEMERIQEDIKTFAQVRIERAYKDGKEVANDGVNEETDN